jgi:DnaJ domain
VELVAILFMVVAGGVIAVFVSVATAIARRENEGVETQLQSHAPERERIAASLLFNVVLAGGVTEDAASRAVRRGSGIAAPVTAGIDITNWADRYARIASPQERSRLLEMAVQLVTSPVPLRQYAALLDLSFGLGFQTDALAKLRDVYGFDYVDHAKDARPRYADRGAPLFVREPRQRDQLLTVLGVSGSATRQEIISAYRRLIAQHHPDRFHDASADARDAAAARFIEITRAYEELLSTYRD